MNEAREKGFTAILNCIDITTIRNLNKHCLVVDDDNYLLMRGTDYRGNIDLFITTGLPNQRAYHQALGRVGRHGDPCKRYIAQDIQQVDLEA